MDITYKQISCILNDNILISFLEKQTNFFDPLKENIKNNRSNIRSKKPDFLLYNFARNRGKVREYRGQSIRSE